MYKRVAFLREIRRTRKEGKDMGHFTLTLDMDRV